MATPVDGGPAFPVITTPDTQITGPWGSHPGMSVLHYLVAAALPVAYQECIRHRTANPIGIPGRHEQPYDPVLIGGMACEMALAAMNAIEAAKENPDLFFKKVPQ